jgi:hypothetical protein
MTDFLDTIAVRSTVDPLANVKAEQAANAKLIVDLRAASARFEKRGQTNNAYTCKDLASKLERFGSFVSEKQAGYAAQLVRWAGVNEPAAPAAPQMAPATAIAAPVPAPVVLPKLFALMQRLSKLTIGKITIARKNQDSLCWVKVDLYSGVVGKIENGHLHLFQYRLPAEAKAETLAALRLIEAGHCHA